MKSFFSQIARPCVMVSQSWGEIARRSGGTLEALRRTLELEYYEGFQILHVNSASERRALGRIVSEHSLEINYCMGRYIYDNKLNISSLDDHIRKAGVQALLARIDDAREVHAQSYQVLSGPSPKTPSTRGEAYKCLQESLVTLCEAAQTPPEVDVLIEPLDITAHKCATLGTTQEAVALAQSLAALGYRIWLILDSAHMMLNGEEPVPSAEECVEWVAEYHLCNCVTDKTHPLYGDHHMRFGQPGFLDEKSAGRILAGLYRKGFLGSNHRLRVFPEMNPSPENDPLETLIYYRDFLEVSWKHAMNTLTEKGS